MSLDIEQIRGTDKESEYVARYMSRIFRAKVKFVASHAVCPEVLVSWDDFSLFCIDVRRAYFFAKIDNRYELYGMNMMVSYDKPFGSFSLIHPENNFAVED